MFDLLMKVSPIFFFFILEITSFYRNFKLGVRVLVKKLKPSVCLLVPGALLLSSVQVLTLISTP